MPKEFSIESARDTEICPGVTLGEAMDVLPKFELSDFQDVTDVNDFIKKMHAYVIVRLHLEGMAGNKEAWKIMAKLHVDRALTRSKIQAVLAGAENRKGLPPGTKAVQIEGGSEQVQGLFSAFLQSGKVLPEKFEEGRHIVHAEVTEIQQNG